MGKRKDTTTRMLNFLVAQHLRASGFENDVAGFIKQAKLVDAQNQPQDDLLTIYTSYLSCKERGLLEQKEGIEQPIGDKLKDVKKENDGDGLKQAEGSDAILGGTDMPFSKKESKKRKANVAANADVKTKSLNEITPDANKENKAKKKKKLHVEGGEQTSIEENGKAHVVVPNISEEIQKAPATDDNEKSSKKKKKKSTNSDDGQSQNLEKQQSENIESAPEGRKEQKASGKNDDLALNATSGKNKKRKPKSEIADINGQNEIQKADGGTQPSVQGNLKTRDEELNCSTAVSDAEEISKTKLKDPASKKKGKHEKDTKQVLNNGDLEENSKGSSGKATAARAFRRVNPDEVEFADPRLQDNSYWGKSGAETGWGAKAEEVLSQVKGKGFRHEKTKKKRGSYKGGAIDLNTHSIKFDNSDDE